MVCFWGAKKSLTDEYWWNNPRELLNNVNILIPYKKMSCQEQVNAITRFTLLAVSLFILFTNKFSYALYALTALLLISLIMNIVTSGENYKALPFSRKGCGSGYLQENLPQGLFRVGMIGREVDSCNYKPNRFAPYSLVQQPFSNLDANNEKNSAEELIKSFLYKSS